MKSGEDTPRHILIVEDDPNTAEMLTAYFTSLGYTVTCVAWGEDAIRFATKIQPDLAVLDIHLPDIDGYEVCERLRSQRRTENTPVIFLTERRERLDRLQGLELGAVDYITKPFDVQELRIRVRNILNRDRRDIYLNPVTGLPTSALVTEQVDRVAHNTKLSLIRIALNGMAAFKNSYGFVTHDDVLRAVALILQNTAVEFLKPEPFVGQLNTYQFVVVAPANKDGHTVTSRLDKRLKEAISFFYPHRDWERGQHHSGDPLPKISFDIAMLSSDEISDDANPTIK